MLAGTISLTYCPTSDMLADIFTKPLVKGQFEKLRGNLPLIIKLIPITNQGGL